MLRVNLYKLFLAVLLVLFLQNSLLSQQEFGVGIVSVIPDTSLTLYFYETVFDSLPSDSIQFAQNEYGTYFIISEEKKTWLNPEWLKLDYEGFLFRCTGLTESRFEVIVNKTTSQKYWIEQNNFVSFSEWNQFLTSVAFVERIDVEENPIRVFPSDTAAIINYGYDECFTAVEIRGDWMKIQSDPICESDFGVPAEALINEGWIRCKNEYELLVNYSMML